MGRWCELGYADMIILFAVSYPMDNKLFAIGKYYEVWSFQLLFNLTVMF